LRDGLPLSQFFFFKMRRGKHLFLISFLWLTPSLFSPSPLVFFPGLRPIVPALFMEKLEASGRRKALICSDLSSCLPFQCSICESFSFGVVFVSLLKFKMTAADRHQTVDFPFRPLKINLSSSYPCSPRLGFGRRFLCL